MEFSAVREGDFNIRFPRFSCGERFRNVNTENPSRLPRPTIEKAAQDRAFDTPEELHSK